MQATEIQGATLDDQRLLIGCIGGGNNVIVGVSPLLLFLPLQRVFSFSAQAVVSCCCVSIGDAHFALLLVSLTRGDP